MAGYAANAALWAVAKQATKGTYAASPQFKGHFTGGDIDFDRQIARLDETSGTRDPSLAYVQTINAKGAPQFYARPGDIVLWLEACLGSRTSVDSDMDADTDPPYTHTITPTNAAGLPYLSVWQSIFGPVESAPVIATQFKDVICDSLKLAGGNGLPLEVTLSLMGLDGKRITGSYPSGADTSVPFMWSAAELMKGGDPLASVNTFEVTFENASAVQQGNGSLFGFDVAPGQRKVVGQMNILFESLDDYANFHFNSPTGTDPSAEIFAEELILSLTSNDGDSTLELTIPAAAYTSYAAKPDKGGAPVQAAFTFEGELNGSDPICTVVVVNDKPGTSYDGV